VAVCAVVLVHRPYLQDRHLLPVRYPQRPLHLFSSLHFTSCILACWQVIFDDQPTRDFSKTRQKAAPKFQLSHCTIRQYFPPFLLAMGHRVSFEDI
jgi:hypothetical protein